MTSVKNSDVYWLGKVASDWEIAPAWRVMKERGEKSLPDDVHLTPSQTHGVLTQQDYMDRTGNKVVLNLAGADNMKRVRAGDFIIHLRSFEGGIEASAIDGKVSNAYTVLTPAPDAHFGYYRWFMKSVPLIEGLASSTDQLRDGQSINFSRFSRLSLPFPPLETQRRIADYLDRETAEIDAAVADLDRYVELLEKRRLLIVDEILCKSKFPAAPIFTVASLKSGDSITSEYIQKSGEFPVYGGNGLRGYTNNYNQESDRILIGRQGALCGNIHLAKGPFFATEHALVVSPRDSINLVWFEHALRDLNLGNLSQASAQPGISAGEVVRQRVHLPPLSVQNEIATRISLEINQIDSIIADSTKLRDLLLKRRSVLITEVVTGRKQV